MGSSMINKHSKCVTESSDPQNSWKISGGAILATHLLTIQQGSEFIERSLGPVG